MGASGSSTKGDAYDTSSLSGSGRWQHDWSVEAS
ncbi:uncharacterized protein METZ01_LOCUS485628 [marine metagenome]|uniref:Uncharacterized protein n=1 Tax=marine metagenome TaxID=408172 RepID=A0A383CKW6_9ZZZZ